MAGINGKLLNEQWRVGARHALYEENGKFYMPLERFPGAYFDANGYVLFETRARYENCAALNIGVRVNVDVPFGSHPSQAQPGGFWHVYRRLMQVFPHACPLRQTLQQDRAGGPAAAGGIVDCVAGDVTGGAVVADGLRSGIGLFGRLARERLEKHGTTKNSPWYERKRIDTDAGERWFCTEREAVA